jgi:hypothetical protein
VAAAVAQPPHHAAILAVLEASFLIIEVKKIMSLALILKLLLFHEK